MTLLITIASFIVTVGILVVIHEFGHYLAARAIGVKILRFSVGFGKTLWMRRIGRDRTEWVVAAVPLGGFVKMLDEREGEVRPDEIPRAFNQQSVAARVAIVLAGPFANFLLAVLLHWALFVTGLPGMKAVVGDALPNTPAAMAGFANGDILVSIGEEPVATSGDARWLMLNEAVRHRVTPVEVQTPGGARVTRNLDMSGITKDDLDKDLFAKLGIRPYRPPGPSVVGRVLPGSAAELAGLKAGDHIFRVAGKPVSTWPDFTREVEANPGRGIAIEIERDGRELELSATPAAVSEGDLRLGRLGVEGPAEVRQGYERMLVTVRYGPLEALGKAVQKVYDLSIFCVKMLGKMIVGDVSWKNLSGPITIADYAGQSVQHGWISWFGFLALVSVSLGVLNLLPIPLLDGGHLVYYFAEIVRGKPVSERAMEIGQRFGLALLLGLTFFAFYNDINRLFTG